MRATFSDKICANICRSNTTTFKVVGNHVKVSKSFVELQLPQTTVLVIPKLQTHTNFEEIVAELPTLFLLRSPSHTVTYQKVIYFELLIK